MSYYGGKQKTRYGNEHRMRKKNFHMQLSQIHDVDMYNLKER